MSAPACSGSAGTRDGQGPPLVDTRDLGCGHGKGLLNACNELRKLGARSPHPPGGPGMLHAGLEAAPNSCALPGLRPQLRLREIFGVPFAA